MNDERKLVTKSDIIILSVIILLAVAALLYVKLGSESGSVAVISVDSEEYARVPLNSEEKEFTLDNGVKIILSDGKIGFADSDCPDLVCVHTGMLSHTGDVAACVPNKTVIEIVGEKSADVDTITY